MYVYLKKLLCDEKVMQIGPNYQNLEMGGNLDPLRKK
jgi:hypothetical protein